MTKYADELLDQSQIEWPEKINIMQTNWIGRSQGVDIEFDISEYRLDQAALSTFTTRIDTIFGVTFVVLAPEHPLVDELTLPEHREEVAAYVDQARRQTEIERMSTEKEKTGVFTGSYAVNRLNGDRVPILIGDYVLLTYGTGIVMGVPAHDQRDFEFATKYDLPIRVVVAPPDWDGGKLSEAYVDEGTQVNSGRFDGPPSAEGKERIADHVEEQAWGKRAVQYRMRDWLISRQRYWGTPIPIVYCDGCGTVPVPEDQLPVLLPEDAEFLPTGESPLQRHEGFLNTSCPACGGPRSTARRIRWTRSSTRPGTSCGSQARTTTRGRSTWTRSRSGTRSTSTRAAPSTPSCTCCTPGSSPRRCVTWGCWTSTSPSRGCSTRGT